MKTILDIPKALSKLAKLSELATRQTGTPEGAAAERILNVTQKRLGTNLTRASLVEAEVTVSIKHTWDRDLARVVGYLTCTDTDEVGGELRFRGIKVSVDEANKHYIEQQAAMEKLMGYTVLGYLMGTFGREAVEACVTEHGTSDIVAAGVRAQATVESEPFSESAADLVTVAMSAGSENPVVCWEGLKA